MKLALFTVLLVATATAQTPKLSLVSSSPSLQPLSFASPSRILTTPTPSGPAYLAQWPGTYLDTAFRGTTVYLRIGPNHAIFHLLVDSNPSPLLLKAPAPGLYRLSDLPDSAHTLRLEIATESQDAPNTFNGFALPAGETPQPLPTPQVRQIEFIGDSHTVGYGNTSPTQTCTSDDVWATTDNSQSFAALTAAAVHADYQVNAISGRGIVRNYDNFPGDTLPAAYPYTLFHDKHPYLDPAWRPQLLILALGTNDFSTPLHPTEPWKSRDELHADFEASYIRFLQLLRARNPHAWILLWATDRANGEIEAEVGKVFDQARAQGLTRLDYLPVNNLAFTACHGHPSLADDKSLSLQFATWIENHPDLWPAR